MAILAALAIDMMMGRSAAGQEEVDLARRTLAGKELSQVSEFWLAADEVDLRHRLDSLDRLERAYYKAQERVDELVAENQRAAKKLAELESQHRQSLAKLKNPLVTGSDRKQLLETSTSEEKQIRQQKSQVYAAGEFGEYPPAREQAVRLIAVRSEMTLAAIAIRRHVERLPDVYRTLRGDEEVRSALATLGKKNRLGPAKDYRGDLKRLAAIDRIVEANSVPVFREDRHFRVPVLLNQRVPAVLSMRHSTGPTVIPDSLARSAGVDIDQRAAKVNYSVDVGRALSVRRGTIRELRIGSAVLRDVPTLVLPPEGEDLGGKLSRDASSECGLVVDGLHLRATVQTTR